MPRRIQLRKIVAPPAFKGYKPYGNGTTNGNVELLYEEYEAIKLADYDHMSHLEASKLMGISRPTFARIYESARQKIARALVEVKEIKSVYGNVYLDNFWYRCNNCESLFTLTKDINRECPMCKSESIEKVNKRKRKK